MSKLLHPHLPRLAQLVCTFGLLSTACSRQEQTKLLDASSIYAGDIKLSLAHPHDVERSDYDLVLSTPLDVSAAAVCTADSATSCSPGASGYFPATLIYTSAGRQFFRSTASALLQNGLVLQLIALAPNGSLTDRRAVVITATASTPTPTTSGASIP